MTAVTRELAANRRFSHLDLSFEPERPLVWAHMRYAGRPCMTTALLRDVVEAQSLIAGLARLELAGGTPNRLRYQVLASCQPGVFSLGGDLEYFLQMIKAQNRDALYEYGKTCVDLAYASATSFDLPFTSIALVQGQAFGGGFEAALSSSILVAEHSATFGFPETVFGLFPGMGALSLLARRVSLGLARRIISSGKLYKAQELYELGVVDLLVEDGRGQHAVRDYIDNRLARESGFYALDRAADRVSPLSYGELTEIVGLWVDTAMRLSEKNLGLMAYLLKAQKNRWEPVQPAAQSLLG